MLDNNRIMPNFQLYGFCLIVSASLVALLSMSTDFFVAWVDDIVIPCQHDSVWTGTGCNCGNSRGVYGGTYCDECQCTHQGICGVLTNGNSRWGCRCPFHTKWTGTLCDKCYTQNKDEALNRCSGPCLNGRSQHFGPKCDTVCIADGSSADDVCREISSGGGVCNACNGHGACTTNGQCDCAEGWFNTIGGEQCALSCPDVGINCNPDTGLCQSVGGELQCVCQPGYYGANCDLTCDSLNDLSCSGHGNCALTALGVPTCTCQTHYVGDMCQYACPGDKTFPTSCSGHGECFAVDNAAVCTCDASTSWTGTDCSCNAKFTCSGHGTCLPDATCDCNDFTTPTHQHWTGGSCQKCQEHWSGRECHLRCDPDGEYIPDEFSTNSVATDGLNIGCNGLGTCELFKASVGERVKCSCRGTDPSWFCAKCEASYYPLTSVDSAAAYCTTECNEGTCSYRGLCNDAYNGTNDLCICDTRIVGSVTFDTIDPKRFCSACKENWYPGQMDSSNACTHYCAVEGEIENKLIVFGTDLTLQGDTNAQRVCAHEGKGYSPDPDCRVCSDHGTCRGDGECQCDDSRTGVYCEIDCGASANGQVCSGHGRCVRNDLDMWFDPFTTEYRCECQPYDTYTAETRQRLIKNGIAVEPPISPDYYGRYCEFHCPMYNEAICAGRGDCKTGIAVPETGENVGHPQSCSSDLDCKDIPGGFCAQLSSPWDSLMKESKSFFSSGPESPGYFTCGASQNCLDAIYSIAWDDYCVSMLNGWYPNVLNTATCTYHSNNTCRETVENYFVNKHAKFNGSTWCESAMVDLSPIDCATKDCDDEQEDECCQAKRKCSQPANQDLFNFNEELCFTWTLEAACSNENSCTYDKTYDYVQSTDLYCASLPVENNKCLVKKAPAVYAEQCKPNFDGSVCETKTYCRAKTCEDAILKNNVEALCINVEPACETLDLDKEWAQECTHLTGQLRPLTDLNVKDTFFSCVMYEKSANPQKVSLKIPGAATIFGEVALKYGDNTTTDDIPIQTFRQHFLQSRILLDDRTTCGQQLSDIDFSSNKWCDDHLKHVIPSWSTSLAPAANWFQEYMVYCSSGIESLWTRSSDAIDRIQVLNKDCTVQFKCQNRENPTWDAGCPESDSVSVHEKKWILDCLDTGKTEFDQLDWSTFPKDVSSCKLSERETIARWGHSKWTLGDIEEKFGANCEDGLKASWIPKEADIPTICSMGACADGHNCVPCSSDTTECHSGVICIAESNINCYEDDPCQNGGQCYQPSYFEASNKYFCEWEHPDPVIVLVGQTKYEGVLTSREQLIIYAIDSLPKTLQVEMGQVITTVNVTNVFVKDGNVIVPSFTNIEWLPSTSNVSAKLTTDPLPPVIEQCAEAQNFNWYKESHAKGKYLLTGGENGLQQGWSITNNILLDNNKLLLTETEKELADYTFKIIIDTENSEAGAGLAITVGDEESFWYVDDDYLPYANYTVSNRLNRFEIQRYPQYDKLTGKLKLRAMFDKKLVLVSILINGIEQILEKAGTLISSTREFYKPENLPNVTSYASWSFGVDGSASIFRDEHEVHPPTQECSAELECSSVPPPNGIRWAVNGNTTQKRIHGWAKIQDTHVQTANMIIYNGEFTPIVDAYIYQKRLYMNGKPTECKVNAHEWWHWTFDVKEIAHTHFNTNQTDIVINEYVIAQPATTVFNSTWSISASIGDCRIVTQKNVLSIARILTRHRLMGAHFHDIPKQEEHECLAHCHAHKDCRQWSWTPNDQHCFLHSELCSDETCTLGSHSMNEFHPHDIAYLDVFSYSRKTKATWNYIRMEDIIEAPFTCPRVDIDSVIPPLWQEAFRRDYQPLEFDTTSVCNQLYTMWEPLPGYNTYNCEGRVCKYNKHDLEGCANYMQYSRPNVTSVDGCKEEKEKFLALDWTSYCRYERSFYDTIPFLGGRQIKTAVKTMESMCSIAKTSIMDAQNQCLDQIDIEWFGNCFKRTADYENFCHVDCINHIESMLDDGPDPSICDIRQDYLALDIDLDCDCTLDNIIITDFCTSQNAYHVRDTVKVPELYNSQCSRDCITTLQDAMNRTTWRDWCSKLSLNEIPGTCSKTVCECDLENIGVAGTRCELMCPSGLDDGQELACSGRNGRCFAVDATEIIFSEEEQIAAGEYRDSSTGKLPIWQVGPKPTADGRCQCALGSGLSCSIPCDKCNNGTFGLDMASQYGICDSFNGICRGLAPWMRYNVHKADELEIAYNSTSFESGAKWSFSERFMYESDATLVKQSLLYMNDPYGRKPHLEATFDEKENINVLLRVFNELCWNTSNTNFEYLDNVDNIKRKGLDITGDTTLKEFTVIGSKDCTNIIFNANLTLCYSEGKMFARDETTTLIVMESNAPTRSETAYIVGMTFALHPEEYILAFGGEWDYGNVQTTMNRVYKIDVTRITWEPRDIVFLDWSMVPVSGNQPPSQAYAPIYSFLDTMMLLSKNDNHYDLYNLTLPTPMDDVAKWTRVTTLEGTLLDMTGGMGQLKIYFAETTWIYTPYAYTKFVESSERLTSTDSHRRVYSFTDRCKLSLGRENERTTLKFGGRTVIQSEKAYEKARIYLEEWNIIDPTSHADIVERFHETVRFEDKVKTAAGPLTQSEKASVLDLVERVYMHQGRWTMSHMMHIKYQNQHAIWTDAKFSILSPTIMVSKSRFNSVFDSLNRGYFETDIDTTPNYLNIFFETSQSLKSLVIQGNYIGVQKEYKQQFYIGKHKMQIYLDWDITQLNVRLEKTIGDDGRIEWADNTGIQTFLIVLPLEGWLRAVSSKTQDSFRSEFLPQATGREALWPMFVTSMSMPTHNMMKQVSDFIAYSSSQCSITAGTHCPGTLPHIGLPCSGKGRCNIACQCVCEVAPSVLRSNDDALINIDRALSPYRGQGCEITCPGFDGDDIKSVCSGSGTCQYDGSCSCPQGYTGDACQFKCPVGDLQNICSAHGGCGTKAIELSSFEFINDNYLDTITATNKKNYAMALLSFYGYKQCLPENYIQQFGKFKNNVNTIHGNFGSSKDAAMAKCEQINYDIRKLAVFYKDETFREYPYGMCIGLQFIDSKYIVTTLLKPYWNPLSLHSEIKSIFQCVQSECSFEPADSNEHSISGLQTNLMSPSFEIKMKYVHGASSGIEHYKVNGQDFFVKSEWTPRSFKLEVGFDNIWSTVEYDEFIESYFIRIENEKTQLKTQVNSLYKVYRDWSPLPSSRTLFLAPFFENKYQQILETMDKYILVKGDVGLVSFESAEYECDMLLECIGIVQWDEPYKENYFTLYSETPSVGFEAYKMPDGAHIFLKKMSMVYQGAESDIAKCNTLTNKRAKYPAVDFTEIYDIPIEDIDLSLAKDDETPSVIIGSGLWTNCWERGESKTKSDCYSEAHTAKSYGFAFSDEDSEPVCLIYYKITDQTKIKLGRYNSEARRTMFNPCNSESTYWRPTD